MPADAGAASSHLRTQRPSHGLELMTKDLCLAEQKLDPTAKERLWEERERYRRPLETDSLIDQTHNARLCVAMARDNELVRRIVGCKLALPFLYWRDSAEANAQRLGKYLQMLANARPAAGVTQRDLDHCTD
ncbi:hypothetical protein, partial [Xanthomonas fragariae]